MDDVTLKTLEQDLVEIKQNPERIDNGTERKSASTTLVELALERFQFGISTTGETFAVPKSGPQLVAMLRGAKTSLRGQLANLYFKRTGRAAPQQALTDAMLVIEGMAQDEGAVELYLRVARHDNVLWLDLGDQNGLAVRIVAEGWSIAPPPVLFKRTALNDPLPAPVPGGSLDELWRRLNVAEADRPLVAAWLVAAMYHDIPHPVLAFFGEQGTGKTTAQKLLVSCIDASRVPTRKPPRDADSWVTAAAGSWVVGLDNLTDVQPWLSDSICRAVTGDGDVRRKLYTDGEHAVFAFRRVITLNGIDVGSLRGDLSERLLPIHLEVIPENARLGEDEIWPDWNEAHPRVLGALLDLAASVVSVHPYVRLERKPRMADFAKILAAVDRVQGTDGLRHYLDKQVSIAADSLSGDQFMSCLIDNINAPFTGTSVDLLRRLMPEKPPKGWPRTARAVTQRLHRHAPSLRKAGWAVSDDGGRNHMNAVRWSIVPPDHPEMVRNSSSQDSLTREKCPKRESASLASQKCSPSLDDGCMEGEL